MIGQTEKRIEIVSEEEVENKEEKQEKQIQMGCTHNARMTRDKRKGTNQR